MSYIVSNQIDKLIQVVHDFKSNKILYTCHFMLHAIVARRRFTEWTGDIYVYNILMLLYQDIFVLR